MSGQSGELRLNSLDSLRGIAAVIVLLNHFFASVPPIPYDRIFHVSPHAISLIYHFPPVRILTSGGSMVILFFVLSGFVLSIGFTGEKTIAAPAWAARRILRIWIPFFCAIMLSATGCHFLWHGPFPEAGSFFNEKIWTPDLTPSLVLHHIFMTGRSIILDPSMWSLIVELRISLFFPQILAFTVRHTRVALAGSLILGVLCSPHHNDPAVSVYLRSVMDTGLYIFCFVCGITLEKKSRSLRHLIGKQPLPVILGLWLVTITMFSINPGQAVSSVNDYLRIILCTAASCLCILLAIADRRSSTLLSTPVCRFAGTISYSLYLTHVIVYATVARLLAPVMPLTAALTVALIVTIPFATLFFLTVEKPTITLSRKAGRALQALSSSPFRTVRSPEQKIP